MGCDIWEEWGEREKNLIARVHHKDESVRVLVVEPPEAAGVCAAAHVPDGEDEPFVLDALAVEAHRWDDLRLGDLAVLETVEDGRLARAVEAEHEAAHLLLAQEFGELGEEEGHGSRTLDALTPTARREMRATAKSQRGGVRTAKGSEHEFWGLRAEIAKFGAGHFQGLKS